MVVITWFCRGLPFTGIGRPQVLQMTVGRVTDPGSANGVPSRPIPQCIASSCCDGPDGSLQNVAMARAKTLVRGAPVIETVLEATIAELAKLGYQGLSVEQVALRAGVARTTVYRRWPTKAALVKAAIESMPGADPEVPAAADVTGTLIEFGMRVSRFLETAHGLAVMRLFVDDHGSAELTAVLEELRAVRDDALHRALSRQGLGQRDVELLGELLPAALLNQALVRKRPLSRQYVTRLAEFLARAVQLPTGRPR